MFVCWRPGVPLDQLSINLGASSGGEGYSWEAPPTPSMMSRGRWGAPAATGSFPTERLAVPPDSTTAPETPVCPHIYVHLFNWPLYTSYLPTWTPPDSCSLDTFVCTVYTLRLWFLCMYILFIYYVCLLFVFLYSVCPYFLHFLHVCLLFVFLYSVCPYPCPWHSFVSYLYYLL